MSSESTGSAGAPRARGLGRGLGALLGEPAAVHGRGSRLAPVADLAPGPFQPRRRFNDSDLESLAESIRRRGVVQPVLVRPGPEGAPPWQIVAGERRWRAAQRAKLREIPVIVHPLDDREALEVALVENVQRENLGPLEEAEGYRRLLEEFGGTQESLAALVGRSRSHIANMMRLLALPDAVRALLDDGALSAGHGRALLGADDGEALAREAIARGLNVRQTERLAARAGGKRPPPKARAKRRRPAAGRADIVKLEAELAEALGVGVRIVDEGASGELRIAYGSLEQLDFVIERLRGGPAMFARRPPD